MPPVITSPIDAPPVIDIQDEDAQELVPQDKAILLSSSAWLNDSIMDVAQKLVCKALGKEEEYQSVLNWQKRGVHFQPVGYEHIQLLHDGKNHWFLSPLQLESGEYV